MRLMVQLLGKEGGRGSLVCWLRQSPSYFPLLSRTSASIMRITANPGSISSFSALLLPLLRGYVQKVPFPPGHLIRNPRETYSSLLSFGDQFSSPIKPSSKSLSFSLSHITFSPFIAPGLALNIFPCKSFPAFLPSSLHK